MARFSTLFQVRNVTFAERVRLTAAGLFWRVYRKSKWRL